MYIDSMAIEDFNRRANSFKKIKKKHRQQMKKIGYSDSSMARYIKQEERVNKDITPKHLWFRHFKWRRKAKIYNANLERIREGKRTRIRRRSCEYIRNKLDFYEESMRLLTHLEDMDITLRKKEDDEAAKRLKNINKSYVVAKISTMIKLDLSSFDSRKKILDKLNHISEDSFDKVNKFIREYNNGVENEGEKISTLTKESIANDLSKIYIDAIDSVNTKYDKKTQKERKKREKKIESIKKQLVSTEKEVKTFLERKDKFVGDALLFDDFQGIENRFRSINRSRDIEEGLLSKCLEEDVNSIADPDEKKEKIEGLFNDYISNSKNYKAEEGDESIFTSIWKNIIKFFGLYQEEELPESINKSINEKLRSGTAEKSKTKNTNHEEETKEESQKEETSSEIEGKDTNPALTLRDPRKPDVKLSEDYETQTPAQTTTPVSQVPNPTQANLSQQQLQKPQLAQQPQDVQQQLRNIQQQPQDVQQQLRNIQQQLRNIHQQPQGPQFAQQLQHPQFAQQLQHPQFAQQPQDVQQQLRNIQQQLRDIQQQHIQLQQDFPFSSPHRFTRYVFPANYDEYGQERHFIPRYDPFVDIYNLLEQILYKLNADHINYDHPYVSMPLPHLNRILPQPFQLTFKEYLEQKYNTPFPYRGSPFFNPNGLENNDYGLNNFIILHNKLLENNLALNRELLNLVALKQNNLDLKNRFVIADQNDQNLGQGNRFIIADQDDQNLGQRNRFIIADQDDQNLGQRNRFIIADQNDQNLGQGNRFVIDDHGTTYNSVIYSDKETQRNRNSDEIKDTIEDIMSFAKEQAINFAPREEIVPVETKRIILDNLKRANIPENLAKSIVNSDLIKDEEVLKVLIDTSLYNGSKDILSILYSVNDEFKNIFKSEGISFNQ